MEINAQFEKILKPKGYIVWVDIRGKWHSSEVHVPSLAVTHVNWLLGTKRPWQNEPENFAIETWIIPVAKRHQAIKVAKQDYKSRLLPVQ